MHQPLPSDAGLVERARRGDVDAYAELVRRHQDHALAAAYVILGDRHEAEDAAQEAFTNAFLALDRFRPDASFRAWLMRIVINEARDMRSRRRRQTDLLARVEPVSSAESAEATALGERRREMLLAALFDLPEPDRLVLTCRYFLDLSEADIADVLGVARGTVKSRLARAVARLGPILRELGPLLILPPVVDLPHLVTGRIGAEAATTAGGWSSSTLAKLRSNLKQVAMAGGAASAVIAVGAFAVLSQKTVGAVPPVQAQRSPTANTIVVYGGDLSDADHQQVAAALGTAASASGTNTETVSHQELVDALSSEGIDVTNSDAALSSVAVTCDTPGSGLEVRTTNITLLPASEYALALMTAGLFDASVGVAAPADKHVSGETALVGLFKAFPRCTQGSGPDPRREQLSYAQLKLAADMAAGGGNLSQSSGVLLDVINDMLNARTPDDATTSSAIEAAAAARGISLDASTRSEVAGLVQQLRQLDWGPYAHGLELEDGGPSQVRLTPAS